MGRADDILKRVGLRVSESSGDSSSPKGVIVSGSAFRLSELPPDAVKGTKLPPTSKYADYKKYPGYAETEAAGFKLYSSKSEQSDPFPKRDYVVLTLTYQFANKKKQYVFLERKLLFYSITVDGNYYGYHLKDDSYSMWVHDDNKKIRRDLSYFSGPTVPPAKIKTLLRQLSS